MPIQKKSNKKRKVARRSSGQFEPLVRRRAAFANHNTRRNTMAKQKFPKDLFVKIEKDGDSEYFLADADGESVAEIGKEITVGVYRYVETRTVKTAILSQRQ
jgi:hypothetical protein